MRRDIHSRRPFAFLSGIAVLALTACGGTPGGSAFVNLAAPESEPNDTALAASALSATRSGWGSVTNPLDPGDWWAVPMGAGETVRIEMHAIRADQTTWASGIDDAVLTLFAPDGATKLLQHDRVAESWPAGVGDLDFPAFHVPAAGTYYLHVTRSVPGFTGGLYVLEVKGIATPAPFQVESEPNDTALTAQPVVPGTVFGHHVDGEADFYQLMIPGPTLLRVEVLAFRNGLWHGASALYDPAIELLDAGLTTIDGSDDVHVWDPGLAYEVRTPGTYYLKLGENLGSAGAAEYFLFVESLPAPIGATEAEINDTAVAANVTGYGASSRGTTSVADPDYFRFTAAAGDMVAVQVFDVANAEGATAAVDVDIFAPDGVTLVPSSFGPAAGDSLQVVRTILQTAGDHFVRVQGTGVATSYSFRLERTMDSPREIEPNDTDLTANALAGINRISGVLLADGDNFAFTAVAGETVTLFLYGGTALHPDWTEDDADRFGSAVVPRLEVSNSTSLSFLTVVRTPVLGVAAAQGLTDGLPSLTATFVAPTTDIYTVFVGDTSGGGPDHTYLLERR